MVKSNTQHIRGEISTLIVVGMLVIAGVGVLMSSSLGQNKNTTNTQAASESCPLIGNPQLISGGKCQVSTNASKSLVCALIDPSRPAGSQLVAGQDIPNQSPPAQGTLSWTISNGIGIVQLHKDPSITINAGAQYRIVVYNWKDPANCVKQTNDIHGSTVISLFGGGNTDGDGDAPTNTPAPGIPTNTSVPDGPTNTQSPTNPNNTLTPTNSPPTVTPTPPCGQANFIYCPKTSLCVPALAECAGVPTNTPVPQATNQPTNQTSTTTPVPTQKIYNLHVPFIGSGGGLTPTPAASVTFQTTTDLSTQTACSENAIAYMSGRGIREPYICISL